MGFCWGGCPEWGAERHKLARLYLVWQAWEGRQSSYKVLPRSAYWWKSCKMPGGKAVKWADQHFWIGGNHTPWFCCSHRYFPLTTLISSWDCSALCVLPAGRTHFAGGRGVPPLSQESCPASRSPAGTAAVWAPAVLPQGGLAAAVLQAPQGSWCTPEYSNAL